MKNKLMALLLVLLIVFTVGLVACDTQKEIASMSFYVNPQTEYVLGDALNFEGATLEVKYTDGSTGMVPVDSSMVSTFNSQKLGSQILQVTYQGIKTSFTVNVSRPQIASIDFVAPTKTEYKVEQNFSTAGGSFLIKYVNGATESIALTADMCSGYDMTTLGEQTVKVELNGFSVVGKGEFKITVSDKALKGIEVTTFPTKDIYYLGDDIAKLDFSGGVLFLSYDNGYTEYINMADENGDKLADITVTSWDTTAESNYSVVNLEYKGFNTKFTVKVTEKDVYTVEVKEYPAKQLVGTELDLTGLELFLTYNDYVMTETLLGDSDKITVSGYDINKIGSQTITLTFYSGGVALKTTFDLEIYVNQKSIENVKIIDNGETYYQQTSILFTAWQYVVEYNNGTKDEAKPLLAKMIKLVDSESSIKNGAVTYKNAGTKKISITFQDNVSYHEFEVVALEVVELEITPATDATYYRYHDFDVTGITYKVLLNNGTYEATSGGETSYALTSSMVSGYDMNKVGIQDLTITYGGIYGTNFKTTMQISVVKEVTDALGIASNPAKVSYILGDTFDTTGLGINIKYVGDESEELVSDFANLGNEWLFTCEGWEEGTMDFNAEGSFEVYITYAGMANADTNGVYVSVDVHNYLNSISVDELPSIFAGSPLDLSNVQFALAYENGAVVSLTYAELQAMGKITNDYDISNTATGLRAIAFKFIPNSNTELEITFSTNVSVEASYATGIEVVSLPNKLVYIKGDISGMDTTGMVLNLLFSNGTKVKLEDYTVAGFSTDVLGECSVTIVYQKDTTKITTEITITIVEATVSSIAWSNFTPNLTMTEGVRIDADSTIEYTEANVFGYDTVGDCMLTITMSNGDTRDITINDLMQEDGLYHVDIAKDYNSFSISDSYIAVKVEYAGASVSMNVKTTARELSSIQVFYTDGATAITVIEGTAFDFELVKLSLTYNNGTTSMIAMKDSYITDYEGIVGEQEVTVDYNGITCTTSVITTQKELVEITMYTLPKQKYMEGEDFDAVAMQDGVLALLYNNGEQKTVSFKEASINNTTALFNINAVRFNSTEFAGTTKSQPIYVTYSGFTTTFDVYIFDRKYISVEFADNADTYTYTYGESYDTDVTLTGYTSFIDGVPQIIDPSKVTIAYVPYAEKDNYLDYTQYTDHPTEVGKYAVIVVYDANKYGDLVHNYYINKAKTLVIEKKVIYIDIEDASKIYGAVNSILNINVYGANSFGEMDASVPAFAYSDSFTTQGLFISADGYITCMYGSEEVNLFAFTFTQGSVVIDMQNNTNVGIYSVIASGVKSNNYDIKYSSGSYEVEQRELLLTAQSKSVEYGESVGTIGYTVAKTDKAESGLVEGEKLAGSLSRVQGNDIGDYLITEGTLSIANTNYNIIFSSEEEYITIYERVIYVQATSVVMVYGDSLPTFTVKYFHDKSATNTADAFASTDTAEVLGDLQFDLGGLELNSNVGVYTINPSYDNASANYTVVPLSGTVTITPRDLEVVADAVSKVYGEEDVELTYTYNQASQMGGTEGSGAVILEEFYNDNGELAFRVYDEITLELSRIAGEYVGTYTITLNEAELENYNIIFTSSKLTIVQKELVVAIDEVGLSKTFDGKVGSVDLSNISAEGATATDLSGVVLTVINNSRNAGSYAISISHASSNYSVSLADTYTYTINKAIVDIEYLNIQNLVYNATSFAVTAQVVPSDLRSYYNKDGSEITDEFGNAVKDVVTITLNLTSVLNAGTYKATPIRIVNADDNYELSESAMATQEIVVAQRTLVVEMNTKDGGTNCEKVYNGYSVELYEGDFKVLNTLEGANLNVTVTVINPDSDIKQPSDVRYAEDGVTIIGYDIVANQVNDTNYKVVMAKEDYQLVIMPEKVTLSIMEQVLSKSYDAIAPSVSEGVVNPSNNMTTDDISFTFARTTADGMDNTSVGTYTIGINVLNKNFDVTLAESYEYTILPSSLVLTITSDALSKIYDGETGIINENSIVIPNLSGEKPYIHTFASQQSFDNFSATMDTLLGYTSTLVAEAGKLVVTSNDMTFNTLNQLLGMLNTMNSDYFATLQEYYLEDEFKVFEDVFASANFGSILSAINVGGKLEAQINNLSALLSSGISAGSISDEDIANIRNSINNINTMAVSVNKTVQREDTYVAFVMQSDDIDGGNCIASGSYKFTVVTNDFNKKYTVSNTTLVYTISKEIIYIKVVDETAQNAGTTDYVSTYGNSDLNTLSTEFYSNPEFEGDPIEIDITITANVSYTSADTNSMGFLKAGSYKIDYVESVGGSYSINYVTQYYTVVKKELSVSINNTKEFTYGDVVKVSDINNSFVIDTALVFGDTADSIVTSGATWISNDNEGATIFNKAGSYVNAGTYDLNVSGFSASNYTFVYNAGEIVVNKKIISLQTTSPTVDGVPYENALTRTYGESFAPIYNGLLGEDTEESLGLDGTEISVANTSPLALLGTAVSEQIQNDGTYNYNVYTVNITLNEGYNELDNYDLQIAGDYNLYIAKKQLDVTMTEEVGTTSLFSLEAIYGEIPEYAITLVGLYGEDVSMQNDYATELQNNNQFFTFDFKRNVGDSIHQFGSYIASGTEVFINETAVRTFNNYDLTFVPIDYVVTPRPITIGFNKDFYTRYSDGALSMYTGLYQEDSDKNISFTFEGGQYSWYNFVFDYNGDSSMQPFAYDETMQTVFNAFGSDKSTTTGSGEEQQLHYTIDHAITPIHTVNYIEGFKVGEVAIQL